MRHNLHSRSVELILRGGLCGDGALTFGGRTYADLVVSVPIPAVLPFDGRPRALTVGELARFRRRLGHPVCRWYWTRYRLGFWTPVERIAPVADRDLRWPSPRAVGIRAVVDDTRSANTSFREGFIEDLPSYGVDRLNRNRRRSIRWALDHFEYLCLCTRGHFSSRVGPSPRRAYGLRTM